ncbi:hypothetical protein ACFL54_06475, partial [Planctomycetota bacterium]
SEVEMLLYYPHGKNGGASQISSLKDALSPSLDLANGILDDGISGVVASTYQRNGDYYKLGIEDESGKFNLNSSPVVPAPDEVYDIVDRLAKNLFGDTTGAQVAQRIFAARDEMGGVFSDIWQVHDAVELLVTAEEWRSLAACVTLHSWFDKSVITPTYALKEFQTPAEDSYGDSLKHPAILLSRGGDFISSSSETSNYCYTLGEGRVPWDSFEPYKHDGSGYSAAVAGERGDMYCYMDMQTAHFKIGSPRAPVNVNTCKKALLQSLIHPVRGWYLDEKSHVEKWTGYGPFSFMCWREGWMYTGFSGFGWPVKLLYYDIDVARKIHDDGCVVGRNSIYGTLTKTHELGAAVAGLTDAIWERIHGIDSNDDGDFLDSGEVQPKPFTQWQEFSDFIRMLVDDPESTDTIADIPGFDYYQADAIIANFNPNTNINDYNPDSLIYRHVDKSQLSAFSNELCFEPTGSFSIQSHGFILDAGGDTRAQYNIHSFVKAFEIIRFTTQADFMGGYDQDCPNPNDLYYEGDNNFLPSKTHATISESDGMFATAGSDWGRVLTGADRQGFSLVSYPEPLTVAPGDIAGNTDLDPPRWHKKWDAGSSTYVDDPDFNYLDDSVYDGYLALATYQQRLYEVNDAMSVVNFNLTLRASEIPDQPDPADLSGNIPTREMIKGFDPDNNKPRHPDYDQSAYPAKTFIMSPNLAYMNGTTQHVADWVPKDLRVLFSRAPTPMNNPTADRLTYAMPADPLDPAQRMIPGVLHPDGGLSDAGRSITFQAANVGSNVGKTGSIQMWIKPNFDPAYASRVRTIFSLSRPFRESGYADEHLRPYVGECMELFYHCRRGYSEAGLYPGTNVMWNMDYSWAAYNSFSFIVKSFYGTERAPDLSGGTEIAMTGATNHSFKGAIDPDSLEYKYNFEGRKWNHVALSWIFPQDYKGDPDTKQNQNYVVINGQTETSNYEQFDEMDLWPSMPGGGRPWKQEDTIRNFHNDYYGGDQHNNYWGVDDLTLNFKKKEDAGHYLASYPEMRDDYHLYARLGNPASEVSRNYVSDSSYDEVFSYGDKLPWQELAEFYEDGRYFGGSMSGSDAGFYTSQEMNLFKRLNMIGRNIIRPRSVSWTLYWPMHNDYLYESGNRGPDANSFAHLKSSTVNTDPGKRPNNWLPDPLWDPIVADIYTTKNRWIYGGDDSDFYSNKHLMLTCGEGSRIGQVDNAGKTVTIERGDKFRFRLYFNIDPFETVYESPVLDDVTLTFTLCKPAILIWRGIYE